MLWAVPTGFLLALSAGLPRAVDAPLAPTERSEARAVTTFTLGMRQVSFSRSLPPKWTEIVARHERQISENVAQWRELVSVYKSMKADDLLQRINDDVNKADYISDGRNWKTRDYWSTPKELFERGGDCEDFAIAKYLILREVGVSAQQMELAVGQNHAFLIVMTQGGSFVLDSARAGVHPLNVEDMKKIVFTVNDSGWAVNIGRGAYQLASR